MAVDKDGFVYAGTSRAGLFRTVGTTVSVAAGIASHPTTFRLEQNYPNPFNPQTSIQFILPESRFVTLKVFNLLGQEIATLADEFLAGGTHVRVWSGAGHPSGVYFYRLRAGEYLNTKRMVLLK